MFGTAKRFLYVCQGEQQAKRNNAPQLLMHENTWGKQKGEDLITNQSMSQLLEGRESYYWTTPSFAGKCEIIHNFLYGQVLFWYIQ